MTTNTTTIQDLFNKRDGLTKAVNWLRECIEISNRKGNLQAAIDYELQHKTASIELGSVMWEIMNHADNKVVEQQIVQDDAQELYNWLAE